MSRTSALASKRNATVLGVIFVTLAGGAARADEPRLSIGGYDPVAYFTDGKPVQGNADFEYLWHRSRWRFASNEHRDLFSKNPERYAPQYDGYCAMGASRDAAAHKDTVDPNAWTIVDGKLYLVHNNFALNKWREQATEYITRANADWHVVKDLPDPVVVGPPCAASPPSTTVALRDGGHWLVIGRQGPLDEAGNLVGKGDMAAQIAQVGKNVDACLDAGGATVGDIMFTVSSVTAPADFDRYADLLARYVGPPSPKSATMNVPQLSSPDYLLEVEAFAAIK